MFIVLRMYSSQIQMLKFLLCDDDDDQDLFALYRLFHSLPRKRRKTRQMILNRDTEGAFTMLIQKYMKSDEDEFVQYFRVTQTLFYFILDHISIDITSPISYRVPNPISAEQKLCVTLRYLATGESHISHSYTFRISRSWIGNIIKCVLAAIKAKLFFVMPSPTREQFERNEMDFERRWNFPNCLGCIDGKHVRVRCPDKTGSLYYNYKDFFSVVLMALVGPDYKFIGVDIGSYGREGDVLMRMILMRGNELSICEFHFSCRNIFEM